MDTIRVLSIIKSRLPFAVCTYLCFISILGVSLYAQGTSTDTSDHIIKDSELYSLQVTEKAKGLSHPWALVFLPQYVTPNGNEYMLVSERNGDLLLVEDDKFIRLNFLEEVAVYQRNQGGWLDLALSPHFGVNNNTVFVSFAETGTTARRNSTTVASFELPMSRLAAARAALRLDISSLSKIFTASPEFPSDRHFGSRVSFIHNIAGNQDEGILAVTVGERGKPENAQEDNFLGKTVALPYQSIDTRGAVSYLFDEPEILSLGHRNAQGMDYDPVSGFLILNEHGAKGGDELNAVYWSKRSLPHKDTAYIPLNYGWPIVSYGINYDNTRIGIGTSAEGYEEPSHYWDPSIAPSGLLVYRSNEGVHSFKDWDGNVFLCSLKFGVLVRLNVAFDKTASTPALALKVLSEEQLFAGEFGRLRDIVSAADGSLYLLTDSDNGKIIQVTPRATATSSP